MEFDILRKIIAEVMHVDIREITQETSFRDDLVADSLDLFQICSMVETRFGIRLREADFSRVATAGDILLILKQEKE